MLGKFEIALTDGKHRFPGDTNFVFVVPEPAFEDILVMDRLLALNLVSRKFCACLLMVDFCNAVFSTRRATLLRYVPDSLSLDDPKDFETAFVTAVQQSAPAGVQGSAEREFLANWAVADDHWERDFAQRIEQFFQAMTPQFADGVRFAKIFELAE
jgi:hypothetical protein